MLEQLYDSLQNAKRHEFKFQKDFAEVFLDDDLSNADKGELITQLVKVQFQLTSVLSKPEFENTQLKYPWTSLKNKAKSQICGSLRRGGESGKDNDLQEGVIEGNIPPNTEGVSEGITGIGGISGGISGGIADPKPQQNTTEHNTTQHNKTEHNRTQHAGDDEAPLPKGNK